MIEIDGSRHSGSGTIVRYSVALATLLGRAVRVVNARSRRAKPGLRRQHLASVLASAELCGGRVEGAALGATSFTYHPGPTIEGGEYAWDIGTAGSATMLTLGILPILVFARRSVTVRVTGGIFQDFAPSPHHMHHVLGAALRAMGVSLDVRVVRAGYVPRGVGLLEVRVEPVRGSLSPLVLEHAEHVTRVEGIALASHLADRDVAGRMARSCEERLAAERIVANVRRVEDREALQPGASLAIWTRDSAGCFAGADQAGRHGRSSEAIGRFVAEALLADLGSGATVDRHLADMLVIFGALASGTTSYRVPDISDHVDSNLWLVGLFGADARVDDRRVTLQGIGHPGSHA